jgi:nucleoid DNA-binding protein
MTFIELVESVAKKTGQPKKVVKEILYATFNRIETHIIVSGGEVKIPSFGRFTQRKTRGGVAFGKELTPRTTLRFQHYSFVPGSKLSEAPEEHMIEKLGVVLEDDGMNKTGAVGSLCPQCGSKLEEPKKCKFCGVEPWEKRVKDPLQK